MKTLYKNQKGEIATILTIISMLVVGVGILAGVKIAQQPNAVNESSFAQSGDALLPGVDSALRQDPLDYCYVGFQYVGDPKIYKLILRDVDNPDKNGITLWDAQSKKDVIPIDKKGDKISVRYNPLQRNSILLTVTNELVQTPYEFAFPRKQWIADARATELYVEYKTHQDYINDVARRYYVTYSAKGPCNKNTITTTPIPSGEVTKTPPPSITPDVPTPDVTNIITPGQVTPVVPTISPSPIPAACGIACTPDTKCQSDPTYGPTDCYSFKGLSGPLLTQPVTDSGSENGVEIEICRPGQKCLCMPTRCETGTCDIRALYCGKDTIITPIISETPTPTVTPPGGKVTDVPTPTVPEDLACSFKALAYIEKCNDIDFSTGECKDGLSVSGFNASPIKEGLRNLTVKDFADGILDKVYGAGNNKQIGSGLYDPFPPTVFNFFSGKNVSQISSIESKFPLTTGKLSEGLAAIIFEDDPRVPEGVNPLAKGSSADLDPNNVDRDLAILFNSRIQDTDPKEYKYMQFYNFESASVSSFFDPGKYRVVPNGNKIVGCTNSLTGETGTQACDVQKQLANAESIRELYGKQVSRSTIDGLNVGCGQTITYGWTLQQCKEDFDFVFVIDTSLSMQQADPNYSYNGRRNTSKIDAVKDTLVGANGFMDYVQNSASDSRVAVISFNENARLELDFTDVKNAEEMTRTRTTVANLNNSEGTNIEKALLEAKKLIDNRSDSSRAAVVVFLTDGLPNNLPNVEVQPDPFPGLYAAADGLRKSSAAVIAIGYGDARINDSVTGEKGELIKGQLYDKVISKISSKLQFACSTNTNIGATCASPDIRQLYAVVSDEFNTCSIAGNAFSEYMSNIDVNNDGVLNSLDLILIDDKYFVEGDIPEDVNNDGIVNALDVTLIIEYYGTVVNIESN